MAFWWQHADPADDPRYYPAPVPSAGVFDSPLRFIPVNVQWIGHIDGLLQRLLSEDAWLGTDAEVEFAIQEVNRLLARLDKPMYIVGEIRAFGMETLPPGWLKCDGAAVSRTEQAALFSAIGTAFGEGDGETTFNLPDLIQRAAVGFDGETLPIGEKVE